MAASNTKCVGAPGKLFDEAVLEGILFGGVWLGGSNRNIFGATVPTGVGVIEVEKQ